jgi:hypothetical protein
LTQRTVSTCSLQTLFKNEKIMTRQFVGFAIGVLLCLPVSLAHGQARGKAGEKGEKAGEKRPGDEKTGGERLGGEKQGENRPGGKPGTGKSPGGNWSTGKQSGDGDKKVGAAGLEKNKSNEPSGAEGAAAGAAASNRKSPNATGAEGAAAGAAASNRNSPNATGAQGAAAGVAAVNRNSPNATGAQGAAAGAAVANRNSPQYSGAAGAAAGYATVRNSFDRPDMYGAGWYGTHTSAWTPAGWAAGAAWTPTAWSGLANHFGYGNSAPVSYNYGSNVTCVNGNVLLDGQNIGTAEAFSQQAADLAQAGANAKSADTDKWLPLGVFALVRNQDQHPQLILQLAINQQGNLRGNYTDETTDNTLPIQGGVDQKTQRAAWTVGSNTSCVMEAGLSNLTQGEAPALLHKNGKTELWYLVRLDQPK